MTVKVSIYIYIYIYIYRTWSSMYSRFQTLNSYPFNFNLVFLQFFFISRVHCYCIFNCWWLFLKMPTILELRVWSPLVRLDVHLYPFGVTSDESQIWTLAKLIMWRDIILLNNTRLISLFTFFIPCLELLNVFIPIHLIILSWQLMDNNHNSF